MRGLRASIWTDVATRSMFSSVSANAELREAKLDGNPAGTAQLPPASTGRRSQTDASRTGNDTISTRLSRTSPTKASAQSLHRTGRPAKQSRSGKTRAARRCMPPRSRRDGKMIGRARRPSSRSEGTPPPQPRCRDEVVADHSRRLARSTPTADRPAHYFGGGRSRKTATSDPSSRTTRADPGTTRPLNTGHKGRTQ
jgi:hypothetical protein